MFEAYGPRLLWRFTRKAHCLGICQKVEDLEVTADKLIFTGQQDDSASTDFSKGTKHSGGTVRACASEQNQQR